MAITLRILSVAWECPSEPYGGLGVFISRLLPEMTRDFEVTHYCLYGYSRLVYSFHGARVIRVHEPLVDRGGGVLVLTSIALGGELMRVVPLFDVLISHDVHGSLVVACGRELGVRSIYYVHTWTFTPLDVMGALSASRVLCNSEFTASQIKSTVNIDVKVVYPASPYPLVVDRPNKPGGDKRVIVIPSRWQDNKSPRYVINALGEVRKRFKLEVVVFGRGAELYELPSWVINAGTVSEEEKLKLYRRADLVLQVGFPEPFGLVALEAISQGAPTLVSNQSGVAEVLPGEAVYSLDNIVEKITQYLDDNSLREELWFKERDSWIMKRTWRDVWSEVKSELK